MDPRDEEQVMIQQGLIGLFNSVPHSRVCAALHLMLYRLQEHFGQTVDESMSWPFRWITKQAPKI